MTEKILHPDYSFLDRVEAKGPFMVGACFQCKKCTNGCPVTFAMDIHPDEVMRLVLLGREDTLLSCRTIWVCASCETCTTRCPNGVKIAELMDCLKEMATEQKREPAVPEVLALHNTFINNIDRWGRVFEGGMLPEYLIRSGEYKRKLKTGEWLDDMKLAAKLFLKGRFSLLPKRIRGRRETSDYLSKKDH